MIAPIAALVGGESLLGREIREIVEDRKPPFRLRLIGSGEAPGGLLTEQGDEPVLMAGPDEETLRDARAVVLACTRASALTAFDLTSRIAPHAPVIDLSGALEERPEARLRATVLETDNDAAITSSLHVIAHPAAQVIALLLRRIHSRHPLRRCVVTALAPASELGQAGIDELQKQTVNLLSFKPLPKKVYDQQIGFSLLARFGSEAPEALSVIEARVERHLATLLHVDGWPSMPSIRVAQAPVFHGYSFSIWIDFERNPGAGALREALACAQIDVRGPDVEGPTNVGVAGQPGATVEVEDDRSQPSAAWIWAAADNYRIAADCAVDVVGSVVGAR